MSETTSVSRKSANRIGQYLSGSFQNYLDHWQEWIAPMLIAAAITIGSIFCCLLPYFLLLGPVMCGLYCCAFNALRGKSVAVADFKRGWQKPATSSIAWLFISLMYALPILALYGVFFAFIAIVVTLAEQESRTADSDPMVVEVLIQEEAGGAEDNGDEAAVEGEAGDDDPETESPPAVPETPASADESPQRPEEPSPGEVFLGIGLVFGFYAFLFLAMIMIWVWTLWFSTRTMFVLPLIADRQFGFVAALRASWKETRNRFWELLAINFLAGIIGSIGIYAMYVGLLFTMPLAFTIIASVYKERFPPDQEAEKIDPTPMATDHVPSDGQDA